MAQTVQHQSNTVNAPRTTPLWLNMIRGLVGLLFIFSGLIKANDPNGLAFKMQEFFSKWDMSALNDATYVLAVIIIMFEILAGVALLIGYRFRLVSVLLIALMVFFLFLTGYAVYFESVTGTELKCGCFGDCIPLTAWQSFWKDVILLILTIILFIRRSYIKPLFSKKSGGMVMLVSTGLVGLIIVLALRNLPYVDCLPFKVGNNVQEMYSNSKTMSDKIEFSYEFTIDGKKVIKTNEEYMNDTSLHSIPYDRVIENVIEKAPSYVPIMRDYFITDPQGVDFAEDLFNADGYFFAWYIRDVSSMNQSNIDRIKALYQELVKGTDVGLIVITSSPYLETRNFLESIQMPVQVFTMTEVSVKTTVRSNPGLLLYNKGEILGKWSPANYPEGFTMEAGRINLKN